MKVFIPKVHYSEMFSFLRVIIIIIFIPKVIIPNGFFPNSRYFKRLLRILFSTSHCPLCTMPSYLYKSIQ